jgi:acyl-CoA thioesterase-1
MNIRHIFQSCFVLISILLTACGGGSDVAIPAPTKPVVILAFGDSLTAGSGIATNGSYYQFVSPGNQWVQLLANKIRTDGIDSKVSVIVYNASLGGEFTGRGSARLPSLLAQYKPTHVLLGHGTNDALSNLPLGTITGNLGGMASAVRASGAKPFILGYGFQAYGADYATQYANALKTAASNGGAIYIDITSDTLFKNQYYHSDLIHLNDTAQSLMLNKVVDSLYPTMN